ncbi:site-specific DNA-methyltransferase, partial [Planctomycetota bacterium]
QPVWKEPLHFSTKNSTLSMIKKRLVLAKRLLKPEGVIVVTIDDHELHHLVCLMDEVFGPDNHLGNVVIRSKPSGRATSKGFSVTHEYAVFYGATEAAYVQRIPKTEKQRARYGDRDQLGFFTWENFRKTGQGCKRKDRPKQFFPLYVCDDDSIHLAPMRWDSAAKSWEILSKPDGAEVWPISRGGEERVWKWSVDRTARCIADLRAVRRRGTIEINKKTRMTGEYNLPFTIWDEAEMSASEQGVKDIIACFGDKDVFSFPKSKYAVLKCIRSATAEDDALILDFFAGSGTTYHATALLNLEDGGTRRVILVTNNEVGEHMATHLRSAGHLSGDPEFEKHGICESITWPRCKYVTQGHRDDGTPLPGTYLDGRPMKEGFQENIEYFRLDFLDPHEVAYGDKFEAILPILWLMAGANGERETARGYGKWFIPRNSRYAVLIREEHFADFKREVEGRPDIGLVFLVTDSEEAFREMSAALPGRPHTKMLYKSYLDTFRINTEESL